MKHRVNVKENLHTAHSGNLLQLCQSFHNPLEKLTFIYNILNITIKDFRSLLSSPSKDQCVLVILVLDIAQPNKKLRIHLKRGVRNETKGGRFYFASAIFKTLRPFHPDGTLGVWQWYLE